MEATTLRRRRRGAIVALGVGSLGVNAAIGGEVAHRLPYLLAGLTVVFLLQTFWEQESVTAGGWLGIGTATLMAAMLVSITYSVNRSDSDRAVQRADSPTTTEAEAATGETTTTLLTGTAVPAEVAGAVESRDDAELLVACESALEQIAAAIRQSGREVDTAIATPNEVTDVDATEIARRLSSCDVRLQAIAATLPG